MTGRGVAWAESRLGCRVIQAIPLTGGWTSTMLRLDDESGASSVLRLMTNEPWLTHGAALTTRESEVQTLLTDSPVPVPTSLALDATGDLAGHPAHLMSLLPGAVEEDRIDDGGLNRLAALLVDIHATRPPESPRDYQSWAWPAKRVVPSWATEPDVWQAAFAVLAGDPPAFDPTFLHRDFHLRNVLWVDGEISGVVDWVETSWGPAWLDVAHCRTNLAIRHGSAVADRFAASYVAKTGREPDTYWDVMDVVGFLPPPGVEGLFTDPTELSRLEQHLVRVLG
ncbi:aminoglycoside phosphotransferase family protein [Nocardioides sp. InS609-2]|uniref:phosphotransferase family protein n=1 Tax=Nocardioides sp. InS609-2 TaxID=2760705 RepID=UPI0020BEAEE1|nr:aminoglycoside phosphotransferase family protein [Nocardioides sp. InS609-2]